MSPSKTKESSATATAVMANLLLATAVCIVTGTAILQKKKSDEKQKKLHDDGNLVEVASSSSSSSEQEQQEQEQEKPIVSPQCYLENMLHSRGYSTQKYRTLNTGYIRSPPTAFQKASFHYEHLVHLVKTNDYDTIKEMFEVGISSNPRRGYEDIQQDQSGDDKPSSLLQIICRYGDATMLQIQLSAGGQVSISDTHGCTPLHDVCKRVMPSSFEMIRLLAKKDPNLFHCMDNNGCVPLSYVPKEYWSECIHFLDTQKEEWWPSQIQKKNENVTTCSLPTSQSTVSLVSLLYSGASKSSSSSSSASSMLTAKPYSIPILDPPEKSSSLTVELTKLVACGSISPEEVSLYIYNGDDDDDDDEMPMLLNEESRTNSSSSNRFLTDYSIDEEDDIDVSMTQLLKELDSVRKMSAFHRMQRRQSQS